MKCFVLFHSDQFFGLLLDDVIVSYANNVVPTSKALIDKSSVGRFHRIISFAAVILLIASITKNFSLVKYDF